MAHFSHFYFSLGFKSLISAFFILRWSRRIGSAVSSRKFSQKSAISFHNELFSAKIT